MAKIVKSRVEARKLELIAELLKLRGITVKRSKSCVTATYISPDGGKCVGKAPNLAALESLVDIFKKAWKSFEEKGIKP